MKKHIYNIIVFCIYAVSATTVSGQTQVTRYTPVGSSVRAYNSIPEMSSQDKTDWSNHVATNYPSATQLNTPSATRSYNCHGYAWHVSQGGDRVWIGYYQGQEVDEDTYWTDGSYIRLSAESGATKISYYQDNHSAAQTSTQGTYTSKWGQGPLMRHARDYGPSIYLMNYRYYYAQPVISGDNLLCYSNSKSYSVQDFHNVTYSWTTSSNLQINGSSTGRTINVSPTTSSNGSGYVRVTINIPSHNTTRIITKNVWIGAPSLQYIQGPTSVQQNVYYTYYAQPDNSNATYYWYVYPSYSSYTSSVNRKDISFSNSGSNTLVVTAQNACGSGMDEPNLEVYVSGYGYYAAIPNPATDYMDIVWVENTDPESSSQPISDEQSAAMENSTPLEVTIYDQVNFPVLKQKIDRKKDRNRISVSNVPHGNYVLHINDGEKVYKSHILIE